MNIKIKDLVGTTYNNFTVLDYKRENKRSLLYVECQICNNKKWMRKENIDTAKSCGCLSISTQFKPKDISNKRFGRLVAIEPTEERDKSNCSIIWTCICDCGNIVNVPAYLLNKKSIKSCGCLDKEIHSKLGKDRFRKIADKVCKENTRLDNLVSKIPKHNTSGVKGVHWDKTRKKWAAQIVFKGKNHYLGRYDNKEEAIAARKKAEEKLFKPILEKYNYKNQEVDNMEILIGKKWVELTEELQNKLLSNANVVDANTCNIPKKSCECIVDLTDNASVVGYYHVTDEEDYITVNDDAVIYSSID